MLWWAVIASKYISVFFLIYLMLCIMMIKPSKNPVTTPTWNTKENKEYPRLYFWDQNWDWEFSIFDFWKVQNAYMFFHPDIFQYGLGWSKCKNFPFWVYPNISLHQTLKILKIFCWFHNLVMNSCNYGTSKTHIRSWQQAASQLKHEHYHFSFSAWKL